MTEVVNAPDEENGVVNNRHDVHMRGNTPNEEMRHAPLHNRDGKSDLSLRTVLKDEMSVMISRTGYSSSSHGCSRGRGRGCGI